MTANAQPPLNDVARTGMARGELLGWLHARTRLPLRHLDALLQRFERAEPGGFAAYAAAPLDRDRAGDQSDGFEVGGARTAEAAPEPRLFIKQLNDPRYHEAWHYLALQPVGAPIPNLYGWMGNPDGREVLFMERLRIDLRDDALAPASCDYETFIRLIAHFNSLRPPTRYVLQLPSADIAGVLEGTLPALKAVEAQGRRGALGPEIARFLARPEHTRARLAAQLAALAENVRGMHRGLIHGDLFPRHVGVRPDTGEWLVIDLLYTQMGPRLFDLAPFLGAPADASRMTRARRRRLAAVYLERYAGAPHPPDGVEALLAEAATLWLAWEFRNLRRWMLSALEETKNGVLPDSRRWLLSRLEQLAAWPGN
jgi:hypothetical protein